VKGSKSRELRGAGCLIVVGGHTRNIGKTQLVVEILRAFPAREWTAMKITQYGHGICSVNGETCGCAADEHTFAVTEERDAVGRGDTCRMLAAGARRVFWVRTKQGRLAEALPKVRERIEGARDVLIESNTVLHFLRPDLYLPVLDFSRADFKESAREFLDRADAYVLVGPVPAAPAWQGVSLKPLEKRPVFVVQPERLCPPALADFIREKVFAGAPASG
jgi:hypothetical protein